MDIDPAGFRQRADEYDRLWKAADEALYALCRQYPDHSSQPGVNAKVMIIGRTYATGIERAAGRAKIPGPTLDRVADFIFKHGDQFDAEIRGLRPLLADLSVQAMNTVLAAHGRLTRLMRDATGGASPRSFVSKYLHFHAPAVPIFDNVADVRLAKLVPLRSCPRPLKRDADSDGVYCDYLTRLLCVHAAVGAAVGADAVTLKRLDYYLWSPAVTGGAA